MSNSSFPVVSLGIHRSKWI
uniref:Uncharacterized protein n=1 Tax=Anguilla anguilla TaxID=7936 RepID=A0A0E9U5D4_ANGAN